MSKDKTKQDLLIRLRTIKGHIDGVERMITEDKDCMEILIQISATKSSINKIGLAIIEDYAQDCVLTTLEEKSDLEESEELITTLKDTINTVLKFSK